MLLFAVCCHSSRAWIRAVLSLTCAHSSSSSYLHPVRQSVPRRATKGSWQAAKWIKYLTFVNIGGGKTSCFHLFLNIFSWIYTVGKGRHSFWTSKKMVELLSIDVFLPFADRFVSLFQGFPLLLHAESRTQNTDSIWFNSFNLRQKRCWLWKRHTLFPLKIEQN